MAGPRGPRKRTLAPGKRPKPAAKARAEIKEVEEIPEHLDGAAAPAEAVVVESAPVATGGPVTGALPRRKRDVPAHIKAALARAEATSAGKDLPEPDETSVDDALVDEFGSRAKPAAKRKKAAAPDPAAPPVPPPHPEKPDPATLPALEGGALVFRLNPTGRRSEYKEEYADVAREMCEHGATDMELADFFRVSIRTIYRWKAEHIAFRQSIYLGSHTYSASQNENVERSLYQNAVGYTQVVEKVMSFQGQIMRVETLEHVPGDVAAQKHWLANRLPDKWKVDPDKGGDDGAALRAIGDAALLEVARRMGQLLLSAKQVEHTIEVTATDVPEPA